MNVMYLDYNATTPIATEVADCMHEVLQSVYGNPSSTHTLGQESRRWIDEARTRVAGLIGTRSEEIVFTGGGSEANNLALKGIAYNHKKGRIISQVTEHPSILEPLSFLEMQGFQIVLLPVDSFGRVDPDDIEKSITPDTILISIQHANNETGTIQPIKEISAIASRHNIPVHTDAAQTPGKISVGVEDLGVQMLTIAGHKLYGPKGVGALYVQEGLRPVPVIHGAGHERGFRAGTEAIHQIVGLGKACQLAQENLQGTTDRLIKLRDLLHHLLETGIDGLKLHGHPTERLPNTLNIGIPGVTGAIILEEASSIAASTGSACHAGEVRMSPVLEAMQVPVESGKGALRLTLGRPSDESGVKIAAVAIIDACRKLCIERN